MPDAWSQSRGARATTRFLRRFWGALLVGAVALAVVVAAVVVPGLKVNDVHLDDAAVYVVNTSKSLVGNLNMQSDELANAAPVGATNYDVIQDGKTVVVRSTSPNQISAYDPATNQMGSPANLPPNATVVYNAGVLAIANPDNGRVWFGPVQDMLKTNFQQAKAQLEVGDQGVATVTASGKVIGLNVAESTLVRPEGEGAPVKLPFELDPAASVQLSAVGDKAVVLDRTGQRIWVEGTETAWNVEAGSTAQLPEAAPSPADIKDAQALYATRAGLVAVTKDGPRSLSGLINQVPAKPLIAGDCIYGAFGAKFVKRCASDAEPTVLDIPEAPAEGQLRFLRNRDAVVLNDAPSGYIWLVDKGMKLIKDWERVTPADKKNNDTNNQTQQVINPNRTKKNNPPQARDDLNLSARVGRSTVLPILDNDSDEDGDILTILGPPTVKGAQLDLIEGGTNLQVTLPKGATSPVEFTYTVSDGRGGTATARARVKPLSADQSVSNQVPMHFRPNEKLVINQNQAGTKRVLLDWRDPDGDDMVLVDAKVEGSSEDQVSFTPDGAVTFQDVGKTTGIKRVQLTVSDGNPAGKLAKSEMLVEVVKGRIVPPVANGDFATTSAGKEITIAPLANDVGENLSLRALTVEGNAAGVTVVPNFTDFTFSFKAEKPGTYYVQYKVTNGPPSTGLVRVDVVADGGRLHRPVAARDVVLLPPGGQVLVDPLLNDSDADGDVLVLQSVSSDPHLSIVMEQRRYLTLRNERVPDKPITLTYWVSDGTYSTQGTIVIIPVKLVGSTKPKAVRDNVKARAGSIVSIPVLANDSSPIGLPLKLDKIVEGPQGRAWVDGDRIRVAVPPTSTGMSLTYQVRDSDGQTESATVNITVNSTDAQNEAPVPVSVEARVLANSTTSILIPLDGLDPNGDPVRLLGLKTGPQLGRVVKVGDGYLSYEAFPTSQGTDSFSYEVVDSLGARGIGEIRVGVAPAVGVNTPPNAVADDYTVRPNRPLHLPLLGNDYDADGDAFAFVSNNPVDIAIKHEVTENNALQLVSPAKPGETPGKYYIKDGRGAQGNGNITIRVAENAKNLIPVAIDDQALVTEIVGKDYVSIEPLKNDYDPDGDSSELTLSVPAQDGAGDVRVDQGKQAINIQVLDHAQQVRYTITDAEGGSASAVVTVPGREDVVPMLKDPKLQLQAIAGERFTLKVNDHVKGTNGRQVIVSNPVNGVFRTTGKVITSPTQLEWTPAADYEGPAALVFEVTDQVPAGDKTGKRAVISIPVQVKPAPNATTKKKTQQQTVELPPALIGNPPVMEIGQGEPETRFDVKPYYRDPNGQDFNFKNWRGNGSGIKWRVSDDGSTIYATAGFDVKPGATVRLSGTVFDAANAEAPAELTIKVVGSTRPRPTTVTDIVDDANAGSSRPVSVLSNDKSNLIGDTKLTLVSAHVESGSGTAKVEGDQVVVTPDKAMVGQMTVRYTVQDATQDPARATDGKILLTVRDKPGQPGVPIKDSVGDGKVVLHWKGAAENGLPINKRVVEGSAPGGKSVSQECTSNTCTIVGLTNGKTYTFRVTESNQLGPGPSSGTSGPMTPDVKPDPPGKPSIKEYGNQYIVLTWPAAKSSGSPVNDYRVTRTDTGETRNVRGTATTLAWKGLPNGVNVTFTVAASNARPGDVDNTTGWSAESPESPAEHATGAPPAPTNVAGADNQEKREGGVIILSWDTPQIPAPANVDKVLNYDIYGNGQLMKSEVPASGAGRQTETLTVDNNKPYVFTVVARNRKYTSGKSAPSQPVTAVGAPKSYGGLTLDAKGDGSTVVVTKAPPNPDTGPWDTMYATIVKDGQNLSTEKIPADQVVGWTFTGEPGIPYWIEYSLEYRGKQSVGKSESNKVSPQGPPLPPIITVSHATDLNNRPAIKVKFNFRPDANNPLTSNGQPISKLKLQVWSDQETGPQTIEDGDVVPFKTSGRPVVVSAVAIGPDGKGEVATKTAPSPMTVDATREKLIVGVENFNGSATCKAKSKAYVIPAFETVEVTNGTTFEWVVDKKQDTSATPPVDQYPEPGTSWSVTCWGGGAEIIMVGKYPAP